MRGKSLMMKIKDGYLLRQVAGRYVVVAVGKTDFTGMISMNETGAFLWKALEKGCTEEALVQALLSEYDVTHEQAQKDAAAFADKLRGDALLEED